MRKLTVVAVLLLAALSFASSQDEAAKTDAKHAETKTVEVAPPPPPPKPLSYYRLDFTVNELEGGNKINSRTYTSLLEAPGDGFFKVGSRVPVSDGHGSFNYMDVGVNFDRITLKEKDGLLTVNLSGDVSSIAAPEQAGQSAPPVLRSARFGGPSVVAPGKPTVLFSLDDVNSKHRFQIELTATKLK